MNILRKIVVVISATLLVVALSNLGFMWSSRQVAGDPTYIKQALKQSGLYDQGIQDIIDQDQKENAKTTDNDIPISQPEIQALIKSTFPPQYIEQQTEQVIDATYKWVHGKTPDLSFQVDFTDKKAAFADGLQKYTEQRLNSLPLCQDGSVPSENINPFTATCRPSGLNSAEIAAKERENFMNGGTFTDTVLNANDIKTSDGQTLKEQLSGLPQAYRTTGWLILGMQALSVLLTATIILLSRDRLRGLRRSATIYAVIGVFSALGAITLSLLVHQAADQTINNASKNEPLQQRFIRAAVLFVDSFRTWWLIYASALILLSIIGYVVFFVIRRKQQKHEVLAKKFNPAAPEGPKNLSPAVEEPDEPKVAKKQKI